MKSLLDLLVNVIHEMGDECSVHTIRDVQYITERVEHEGVSFLTITLPSFGDDFERSLAAGWVDPKSFPGFRRRGELPTLLGGFLDLVFHRANGILLTVPSISAIRAIRQITKLLGKVELDCAPARITRAYEKYVECEQDLIATELSLTPKEYEEFGRMSRLLFSDVFVASDREVAEMRISPRHGPGATAEKVIANAKYHFLSWTERLEDVFPFWRYATSRPRSEVRYEQVKFFEPGHEPSCRLVSVPKTLKTPRIIAIEPTHMQFMQQGIMRSFVENIRKDSILSRMISSLDQEPNQLLARKGSITGDLATLDLSEASDRVLNSLVETMLTPFPHLADGVRASRSLTVSVPGHGIIPLVKFASMGSALCFPMEMFVFLTLVFLGIEKEKNTRFTRKSDFSRYVGQVRIFGDDIIVPENLTESVISHLELYGAKVNTRKSFWTGKFRESCGAEFYEGEDVTIVRVRKPLPQSRKDVHELVSLVDFRNNCYWRGMWKTVQVLDEYLEGLIPFPYVSTTSVVLGRHSVLGHQTERMCPNLHRPMVKGVVVEATKRLSPLEDDGALMKFFLSSDEELEFDHPYHGGRPSLVRDIEVRALPNGKEDHLQYAGRPVSFNTKYRWAYSAE